MVWVQTLFPAIFLKDSHSFVELLLRNCHFDISNSSCVERIHSAQFGVQEERF